jgi:hypothetical protein
MEIMGPSLFAKWLIRRRRKKKLARANKRKFPPPPIPFSIMGPSLWRLLILRPPPYFYIGNNGPICMKSRRRAHLLIQ